MYRIYIFRPLWDSQIMQGQGLLSTCCIENMQSSLLQELPEVRYKKKHKSWMLDALNVIFIFMCWNWIGRVILHISTCQVICFGSKAAWVEYTVDVLHQFYTYFMQVPRGGLPEHSSWPVTKGGARELSPLQAVFTLLLSILPFLLQWAI